MLSMRGGGVTHNLKNSQKPNIIKEIRICEFHELKTIAKNKAILESKSREILEFFTLFFTKDPKPIVTALEFANALALRTRYIRNEIFINRNDSFIKSFRKILERYLYGEIDDFGFADSFAQTLTYSLFLAKLNNKSDEKVTLYNIESFISSSFPLIQTLCTFLVNLHRIQQNNKNQSSLLNLKELIKGVLHIINNIDVKEVTEELNKYKQKDSLDSLHKDPYLHFYETFLSQYDPRLREIRGVYYTPAPVVSFIINAIDFILQKDFGKRGLKSALDSDITLLDFATGTGTFLLEAFEKALENSDKMAVSYNPKALLDKFYGFEYLITPYVVAHLRISEVFKDSFNAEIGKDYKGDITEETQNERLHIYLTNTLYINDEVSELNQYRDVTNPMTEKLVKEFIEAQKLKEQNILIITGNPPYSGASSNEGLYEDEVRITYGLEPSLSELTKIEKDTIKSFLSMATLKSNDKKEQEKLRSEKYRDYPSVKRTFKAILDSKKLKNEKNPKWLLDDYVKFINFAESKIKTQREGGIFAFISNNSFLDNPTFRGMRYSLLKTFDMLYILDLHGNARKKETTPSGDKDDNVFDIMQGVSINIFVKLPQALSGYTDFNKSDSCHSEQSEESIKGQSRKSLKDVSAMPQHDKQQYNNTQNLAKIYHYDLYGKRKGKYSFLLEHNLANIPWQELKPKDPFYLFIPQNESLREEYDKGFSVRDIFKVSGVGICSKRDNIVFHNSKESLKAMLNDFINKPKEELRKIYDIGEDSRDWRLESAIEAIKENKDNLDDFIMPCHYRPFDYRWTYYINKSRAFMAYPVYDVFKHFLQDSNAALLVARQSQYTDNQDFNNIMVSDKMVDLNMFRVCGTGVMPLYLQNTESNPSCHSEQSEESKSNNSKTIAEESTKERKKKKSQESVSLSLNETALTAPQYDNKPQRIENFTQEFRAFINAKYKWSKADYKENPQLFICTQESLILSPEAIFGYIYAMLFHKDYREKYIDFLKVDFPKIPFVDSKETFITLSRLGLELIGVHLMQDSDSSEVWDITREREREREQAVMRMTCNIGLNVARQSRLSGGWQYVIATNMLVDLSLMGGGNTGAGHIFPLYLYKEATLP